MATDMGDPPSWWDQPDPGGSMRNQRGPTLPNYMDPEGNHGGIRILRIQGAGGANGQPLPNRPFIIRKSIQQFVNGKIESAFPEGQGRSYALKVRSAQQYIKLQELKVLTDGTKVEVIPHPILNSTRFVVSCRDVIRDSEEELVEDLKDQGIKEVRRITRREGGGRVNTATLIITCHGTYAPEYIDFGYLRCRTRPYYPSPMQCFSCWAFGHTRMRCKAPKPICGKCSGDHPIPEDRSCPNGKFCARCQTDQHSLSDRSCPSYIRENSIQKIKVDRDLSYPEARRLFDQSNGTRTFAGVTSASLEGKLDQMNRKIEELANLVKEKDRTILQLQAALQMQGAPNTIEQAIPAPTNPLPTDFTALFQLQMEQNNHLMLQMQDRFEKSIKALMATEVQTQRRLLNVEASLPSTAATAPKLGDSQPSVSPPLTSIETPANKPASASSSPKDSCDLSFSSDAASDATITPDNSPNPATKVDTPLPTFLTPKTHKRPITELDHSRRPPRSAQVPKILKPWETSPESPDKKDVPKKKRT
ncbi:uncharacterized protein LOC135705361 [Ochlerotatus camptorhynchus]|uniref:uncharacterized protein LOC135705361 n=1 Tax=Ochlerotatus camptorhynchus TaxID=644619 RepID=UPI0031DBEA43